MSDTPEQLNDANREFELIRPTYSDDFTKRYTDGFQVRTVAGGIPFIGATAYSAPGNAPGQTGPSLVANFFTNGGNGLGDSIPTIINLLTNPPQSGTANPGSEPPVGPEETLRYSCVSGYCLQDPNGAYYGIDECQQAPCSSGGSSGGGGGGSSGGDGSGGGGTGGGGDPPEIADQCSGKAVHCTFAAMILDVAVGSSSGGYHPDPSCIISGTTGSVLPNRTYWKYKWTEVEQLGDRVTWCLPLYSGKPARSGGLHTDDGTEAYNAYEQNVDDYGGNTPPAGTTVTRLRWPNYSVVTMHVDPAGRAWFNEINPVQLECTPSALELTVDGGTYTGGS